MRIRNEKGKFIKVPKPKFFDGQVVTATKKHCSQYQTVILIEPDYRNGWWYGNQYCSYKNGGIITGGGFSFSWPEDNFKAIEDSEIKLAIEKYYRIKEKETIQLRLKILNDEISKIEYVQSLGA